MLIMGVGSIHVNHNTSLGHHTDRGPMGLVQYNSLGEYCGPHTASSVFLIMIRHRQVPSF